MFFIAFNVCLVTLAGKVAGFLGGIDYSSTLWLLSITGGFYLGRSVTGNGKNITISGEEKESK
jgi:hypothetical protein